MDDDPNLCPTGVRHVWVDVVYLRVCRSVQVPGVTPATGSTSAMCSRCKLRRRVGTRYPSSETYVTDTPSA